MTITNYFYEKLPSFSTFSQLTEDEFYQEVPSDWFVIITDVKGSTKAIEEGRYKDVNMVGAATIVSVNNAMKGLEYPYVFGGDGATIVIPSSFVAAVQQELNSLAEISKTQFKLELRIGMVSVSELMESGTSLQIGKYRLPTGVHLAVFQGGALNTAEELIKKQEEKYSIVRSSSSETNLHNLSCRWKPLASSKGKILSLLVSSNQGKEHYQEFMEALEEIIGSLAEANPVHRSKLQIKSFGAQLLDDFKLRRSIGLLWDRIVSSIKSWVVLKFLYKRMPFMQTYLKGFADSSDYHKFDEMLRMVLDLSPQQIEAIQALCEKMKSESKISYGIHLSDHALLTCVVPGFDDGEHVHFVDGGDGGYAMAAKQLKAQLKLIS